MNNLGQTLKVERSDRRWSQEMLAERAGVSRMAIASWENGLRNISESSQRKLNKAFGVDIFHIEDVELDHVFEKSIRNILESDDFKAVLNHLNYEITRKDMGE